MEVKFIDKFNGENTTFYSGDPVTIQIKYNVNAPFGDLVIRIALYSDKDMFCYCTNTDIEEFNVDRTIGNKKIRLQINNLTMIEGKFHLTVATHSIKHIEYDWIDRQFSFNVMKKGNNVDLSEISCEWEQ